jgi:uncharacterized protein with HEPN domain
MDNIKNDRYYAKAMLDDLDRIFFYAERVDFSDPEHNEQALDAIGFRLNHLRQMSQELSADFVRAHPELKLKAISQFRDHVIHQYESVDFSDYRDLVCDDLPKMHAILTAYLK